MLSSFAKISNIFVTPFVPAGIRSRTFEKQNAIFDFNSRRTQNYNTFKNLLHWKMAKYIFHLAYDCWQLTIADAAQFWNPVVESLFSRILGIPLKLNKTSKTGFVSSISCINIVIKLRPYMIIFTIPCKFTSLSSLKFSHELNKARNLNLATSVECTKVDK